MSEEDIKNEIATHADVAMKKLSAGDGDIIVVTFPQKVSAEQMEAFARYMEESIPEGVTVFCTKDDITMDLLPKEQLNKHGWYNINDGAGNTTIQ